MALADVVYETQEPCFKPLNAQTMENYIKERINKLEEKSKAYGIGGDISVKMGYFMGFKNKNGEVSRQEKCLDDAILV